jgi:inosose dehydratase
LRISGQLEETGEVEKVKIAYTGWTWLIHHQDNQKYEFEQFLKEVSDLGYDAVENFAFITKYFDNDAKAVKELLQKYNLEMANLYHHYSDDPEADYAKAVEYVEFMKEIGATYMNTQAVMWHEKPYDRPLDEQAVIGYAELSNRIGKLLRENDLVLCFHPHANTAIYREEEIDLFLANTDPELVGLCPIRRTPPWLAWTACGRLRSTQIASLMYI